MDDRAIPLETKWQFYESSLRPNSDLISIEGNTLSIRKYLPMKRE